MCVCFLCQDVPTIWWANALATGASYGYAYTSQEGESDDGEDETLPKPIRAALKVRRSSLHVWPISLDDRVRV